MKNRVEELVMPGIREAINEAALDIQKLLYRNLAQMLNLNEKASVKEIEEEIRNLVLADKVRNRNKVEEHICNNLIIKRSTAGLWAIPTVGLINFCPSCGVKLP